MVRDLTKNATIKSNATVTKQTKTTTPFVKREPFSWGRDGEYVKWNALNQFNSDHETDNENTFQQMIDMLDCQRLKWKM